MAAYLHWLRERIKKVYHFSIQFNVPVHANWRSSDAQNRSNISSIRVWRMARFDRFTERRYFDDISTFKSKMLARVDHLVSHLRPQKHAPGFPCRQSALWNMHRDLVRRRRCSHYRLFPVEPSISIVSTKARRKKDLLREIWATQNTKDNFSIFNQSQAHSILSTS